MPFPSGPGTTEPNVLDKLHDNLEDINAKLEEYTKKAEAGIEAFKATEKLIDDLRSRMEKPINGPGDIADALKEAGGNLGAVKQAAKDAGAPDEVVDGIDKAENVANKAGDAAQKAQDAKDKGEKAADSAKKAADSDNPEDAMKNAGDAASAGQGAANDGLGAADAGKGVADEF